MRIAVRYYSKRGNTRAVALLIAKAAGCQAEPIEVPLEGAVDLLLLGGAVYWGKIPEELKQYMRQMPPDQVRHAAVFCTTGVAHDVSGAYRQFLQKHDIKVMQKSFCCQGKHAYSEEVAELVCQFVEEVKVDWRNLERFDGE